MQARCHYCQEPARYLCDYRIGHGRQARTCDRPLCERCRVLRGQVIACYRDRRGCQVLSQDWCPVHPRPEEQGR